MRLHRTMAASIAGLALALGTVGGAQAASVRATAAACSISQVGDSEQYGNNNMVMGTIVQEFDSCAYGGDTHTIAQWYWNPAYTQLYGHPDITLYLASMGYDNGNVDLYIHVYPTTDDTITFPEPVHAANPDSWRAGATIGNGTCVAWTSQHYYATGIETAGPYAGCNDNWNIQWIPWTQP
jgi:hypothetical protein